MNRTSWLGLLLEAEEEDDSFAFIDLLIWLHYRSNELRSTEGVLRDFFIRYDPLRTSKINSEVIVDSGVFLPALLCHLHRRYGLRCANDCKHEPWKSEWDAFVSPLIPEEISEETLNSYSGPTDPRRQPVLLSQSAPSLVPFMHHGVTAWVDYSARCVTLSSDIDSPTLLGEDIDALVAEALLEVPSSSISSVDDLPIDAPPPVRIDVSVAK